MQTFNINFNLPQGWHELGDPVDISVWRSDGSILELRYVISLRYSFYGGWRNIKLLQSVQMRKIRDCCIFRVNGLEVFL